MTMAHCDYIIYIVTIQRNAGQRYWIVIMGKDQEGGNNWSERETKELLRIWKQPDIRATVWAQITVLLNDVGFPACKRERVHKKNK